MGDGKRIFRDIKLVFNNFMLLVILNIECVVGE